MYGYPNEGIYIICTNTKVRIIRTYVRTYVCMHESCMHVYYYTRRLNAMHMYSCIACYEGIIYIISANGFYSKYDIIIYYNIMISHIYT